MPWLPLVASPVEDPATITLDMQFDIANSQIECSDAGQSRIKSWRAIGREGFPGQQFILGITSLADAKRYELDTAALETQGGSTSDKQFANAAGRSFVGPSDASMRAATQLMTPDKSTGSWPVPYSELRSNPKGKDAYPGTMLVSTDVPTSGLLASDAQHLGEFLNFVASAGQHPGTANGDLPPGYLPMTAANGLGKLDAYTQAAAQAVTAQKGVVPSVTGSSTGGGSPTPTPPGSHPSSSPSGPGQSSNPATVLPPVKSPSPSQTSPATAPTSSSPTSEPDLDSDARQDRGGQLYSVRCRVSLRVAPRLAGGRGHRRRLGGSTAPRQRHERARSSTAVDQRGHPQRFGF